MQIRGSARRALRRDADTRGEPAEAAKAAAELEKAQASSLNPAPPPSSAVPMQSEKPVQPVQPKVKYGSHMVSAGVAASAAPLAQRGVNASPPLTNSVPIVRMFMGMDRDPRKYRGDGEDETSVVPYANQLEDPRMPRVDSAFAPFE